MAFVNPYLADIESLNIFIKKALENGGIGAPPEDSGKTVTLTQLQNLLASSTREMRYL